MWNSGRERVLRRDEWDHPSYPLSLYCGWIIGGESCNYYKHRICMWKRKIHNDPLHPDSKRLIEFCFFVKRNENEDRGQVGRTGSGEKEKRGGTFPLWENHPRSIPNWPRGDEALRLWEQSGFQSEIIVLPGSWSSSSTALVKQMLRTARALLYSAH